MQDSAVPDCPLKVWVARLRAVAMDLPVCAAACDEAPPSIVIPTPDLQHEPLRPLGIAGRETPYAYEEVARALHFIADMCEV